MNGKIKKLMNFRFDRYEEIEIKLEKLAAKGMLLEECGSFFWTFRKETPQKLKYTVTYFSEGSVFNPGITDNQQTYFDYAKEAGWNFVTQFNQMQIFCSEDNNPIPFETDEKEKFENIKRCMKKSFLPPIVISILVFILNLVVQFNSFQLNPIDFLSDYARIFPVFMFLAVIIYELYSLLNYLMWCKRSEKSIANGGGCDKRRSIVHRTVDVLFMIFIFGSLGYCLFYLAYETSLFGLFLAIVHMPILMIVFWSSIKYLRNKKVSAKLNKIISIVALTIASFSYLALVMVLIMKFGFSTDGGSDYRTVAWQMNSSYSHEYKLYSDTIPLTCEDLYGPIDYDYYSYKEEIDSTFFLSKSAYEQNSLPAKNAPPEIEYDILEPQFDFVYQLAKGHLLKIPDWRDNESFESIDNNIFGTAEAYQRYYGHNPTGEYILFFSDKIIVLDMEEQPTPEQISIIVEKLNI